MTKQHRINKYLYGWKLYVNYGGGWEYETFEETLQGYKANKNAYQQNCQYPQKWVRGRETNPEYVTQCVETILGGKQQHYA